MMKRFKGVKCYYFGIIALMVVCRLSWGMTADELTSKTGIAGGLCSFPQATQEDMKLALELAKRPTFIVHVMAKKDEEVSSIRAAADAAGVLGRSFYVEKGSVAKLPFADHLVDLLVISNMCEADLTQEARAECLRVIQPVRGLALVGNNGTAAVRPSKEKLGTWAGGLPLTKVQEDASGAWVWLRASLPAGSDAWTHRLHGPEGSQISMDTALQAPFLTQWWGLPRGREGGGWPYWGTTVVECNGRMFTIRADRQVGTIDHSLLTAQSMNNGIVLWQRQLRGADKDKELRDGGYVPGRSCAIATEDSLFLVDRDGVLQLDAETGAERRRITGPKPGGQVKWIARMGKHLAVLSGDPDNILPSSFFGKGKTPKDPPLAADGCSAGLQSVYDNPMGRELAVYNIETGKLIWHDTVAGGIDERLIVIRDQRLYCMVDGVGLTCRDLENGKVLWTNADSDIQSEYSSSILLKRRGLRTSEPALSAYKDALILRSEKSKLFVLSRQTGALLWGKANPPSRSYWQSCVWGDLLLGPRKPLNLMTGSETTGPVFIKSGCGLTISTPNYLITCFGRVTDPKSNRLIRIEDLKSVCDNGNIVSDGMMIGIPSCCGCSFELKGYRALASAGNIKPHTAPPWKERLMVFDTAEPAPLKIVPADWPTYRHDAQRSAGSAAIVGEQPKKVLWQWKPGDMATHSKSYPFEGGVKPDFMATAAVAAEGLVWFGGPDGMIRCVKADTGKEVWSFATGSMLFKPPTLWHGRLLAGSGDGYVYCLDSRTGKCLWRLQAAPLDRRVFWYGHLISTWPVLPGVAVQDDIAYTVAGYQKENGVHAYAFNPQNGQVVWEKDDVGARPDGLLQTEKSKNQWWGPPQNMYFRNNNHWGKVLHFKQNEEEFLGLSSYGSIALGANKLWMPSGCLDLKNGASKGFGEKYGCEVGALDQWILQGGRRIGEPENTLSDPYPTSEVSMSILSSNETEMTGITLNDNGTSLPAWDADHVLLPPQQSRAWLAVNRLSLVPRTKLTAWLTGFLAGFTPNPKNEYEDARPQLTQWPELQQWATEDIKGMVPAAFALAKDQAVVAYSDGKSHKLCGYLRATGKQAWTIDLPEQPAMNRLALDRNGRVLVSLCDGSVVCVGQ